MSVNTLEPLIRVENLGKHFGDIKVLEGINVDIYKGDVVFVVGPSGSGKSTIIKYLKQHIHYIWVCFFYLIK